MDGFGTDEGQKRRLPFWMVGAAAIDSARKSDDGNKNNFSSLEGKFAPKSSTESTQSVKVSVIHAKESGDANSHVLEKCETKIRKRRGQQDDDFHGNTYKSTSKKKKDNQVESTVLKSSPRKGRKIKSVRFKSIKKTEIQSLGEENEELTMEDLLSFAEEYVKADKDLELQQLSNRTCGSERQHPVKAISSNESEDARSAAQGDWGLPLREANTAYNSEEILMTKGTVINSSRSGDPAQDMLNLFLGPLLNKPLEEEIKFELLPKDMQISYEFRKQSQNDSFGEERVPLVKKKSSLKDKVAMFLD